MSKLNFHFNLDLTYGRYSAKELLKKTAKKAARGDFTYKGQSFSKLTKKTGRVLAKKGPIGLYRHTLRFLKQTSSQSVVFPNGLVSSVNHDEIRDWYQNHAKPVTVVVPSYNDVLLLKQLLESLDASVFAKPVKVLIVDDYCQEENKKELAKLTEGRDYVEIIYRKQNGGFAKAVNTGLKKALELGHDVVLLNSDIIAHDPHWLAGLQYGAYVFDPKAGVVGAKLLYEDGRIQWAGGHRNPGAPEWFDHYYRFQPENCGPANVPYHVIYCTGACAYIKLKVLKKVGLMDESMPFASEDVDYGIRVWEAGYRVLHFPASVLTHAESVSRPKQKKEIQKQREKESIQAFWKKWGDWFDKRNVRDKDGKIRIIFVLQTTGASGGIKIVFEHANRLIDRGFNVEVWSLDELQKTWVCKAQHRNFENYQEMQDALSGEEAIKVATWWETAYPVWMSSVRKGIPVNFIQEVETWFYPDDPRAQNTVIASYRKEFRNMTTSIYNYEELKKIDVPAERIPCGIDTELFHPLDNVEREDDVLVALGRSFFQKNFKFTFNAWKELGEKRPRMWLFGFEKEMEDWDEKITYYVSPSEEGVNELYNQGTAFVQTSRHEGFSLPPLEAMAAGIPTILTDSHGNRDYTQPDKNCIMVEQDNVPELVAAYKKLFGDKKLQAKLRANGLKTAQEYDWSVVMDRVQAFYEDVADNSERVEYIEKVVKDGPQAA